MTMHAVHSVHSHCEKELEKNENERIKGQKWFILLEDKLLYTFYLYILFIYTFFLYILLEDKLIYTFYEGCHWT